MKAELNAKGVLIISTENDIEVYALNSWYEQVYKNIDIEHVKSTLIHEDSEDITVKVMFKKKAVK